MTSILQGSLASKIHKAFQRQGIPIAGTLRRETAGGQDEYGDPIFTVTTYDFEGFVDDFDDMTRAAAGIPQSDRRVNIFSPSLSIEPRIDDKVLVPGFGWMKLRDVRVDPAKALWQAQAYAVDDPS
ncbi:hypothetical protein [Hyphomonas oceanitis]|uniref:Uncharacterized protein n=1 Tax=Hyphomonas oceanitis SCH89 TaxID=1280953 RepID=A0A059G909_9PROT|nr:hypothetical protein [Hyphomonas oceanitis]KDA03065.1 hypothetical protein HOC_07809 [Hyphomonas oceanitis SCH89]